MTRTILTSLGPSVEGAGPALLVEVLDELEVRLERAGVPLERSLAPGIEPGRVAEVLASAGLSAPAEVVTWFGWRNGLVADSPAEAPGALPFMVPLDVERAVAKYRYFEEHGPESWNFGVNWLPLQDTAHSFHLYCGDRLDGPCLVRRTDEDHPLGEEKFGFQVVSWSTVISWWIEAIDSGATRWIPERKTWQANVLALPSVQLASGMFF